MSYAEFGIIDSIDKEKDYSEYDPERYHCVAISDDRYIDAWWEQLACLKTYFHSMGHPSTGLDRQGISIILPELLIIISI